MVDGVLPGTVCLVRTNITTKLSVVFPVLSFPHLTQFQGELFSVDHPINFLFFFFFKLTRRYGTLCGPTSSSCGGLRPSRKGFFCPSGLFLDNFRQFWCTVVTLVTLKRIQKIQPIQKNPKNPTKKEKKKRENP